MLNKDAQRKIMALVATAYENRVPNSKMCIGRELTPEYEALILKQRVPVSVHGHTIMVTYNYEETFFLEASKVGIGWTKHLSLICRTRMPPPEVLVEIIALLGIGPDRQVTCQPDHGVVDVLQPIPEPTHLSC